MMHSTIGDVRDKVHRGELPAVKWRQQFRFFREDWYPEVPPVMDTKDLAELYTPTNRSFEPGSGRGSSRYRKPGGRKFTFLRHEIFDVIGAVM
jgi:hypothetical protein